MSEDMAALWQWVSDHNEAVITTGMALLVTLVVYLKQRDIKRIDYEPFQTIQVTGGRMGGFARHVEMRANGTALRDPHLATVRLQNTGRKAITSGEYVTVPTITWSGSATLTMAAVVNASSSGVEKELALTTEASAVQATPTLLNRGDWFDTQMLFDGSPGKLAVHARFPDQQRPMKHVVLSRTRLDDAYHLMSIWALFGGCWLLTLVLEDPFFLAVGGAIVGMTSVIIFELSPIPRRLAAWQLRRQQARRRSPG